MFSLAKAVLFVSCLSILWASNDDLDKIIKTSQGLSDECYRAIGFEFPDRRLSYGENRWRRLNELCCGSFPGTTLHGQRLPNGTNFPACMPEVIVPKGNAYVLDVSADGQPVYKLVTCAADAFQSEPRNSSFSLFPYCTEIKSKCDGDGEELFCMGGSSEDDQCTCSQGSLPKGSNCSLGFTKNSNCYCEVLICPEGQVAVRIPVASVGGLAGVPYCSNLSSAAGYKFQCENISSSSSTSSPSITPENGTPGCGFECEDSSSSTSSLITTPENNTPGTDDDDYVGGVMMIVVGVVVGGVLGIVVIIVVCYKKKYLVSLVKMFHDPQAIQVLQIDEPEVDMPIEEEEQGQENLLGGRRETAV